MQVENSNRTKRPKTGGRQKGTPNVVTRDLRLSISALLEGNVDNVQRWLYEVAKTDPAEAVELFLRLLEFITPKLRAAAVGLEMHDTTHRRPLHEMSIAELEAMVPGFG
jgi:hypothetical protein